MNVIKRSFISMCRRPIKSGIFLVLIIILSTFASGATLVRQAIVNTDQNLRRRMPAVATIEKDLQAIYDETGEWMPFETLPPELIRQAANFSQVADFDYAIDMRWGVNAPYLNIWENEEFPYQTSFDYDEDLGVHLHVEGVSQANFLDMRTSFMTLVEGRTFFDEELHLLNSSPYPVLIASGFAKANELTVGSTFDAQVVVFQTNDGIDQPLIENRAEPPLVEETFPLKVIGIFEPEMPEIPEDADLDTLWQADRHRTLMQHRVYVANLVAELMFEVSRDSPFLRDHIFFQNLFLLNDPLDFEDFANEVANLPGSWRATDFSSGFRDISASMISLREIADSIFYFATATTLLLIGLLVLLYLYDRKHEIGIYLALGEKKSKIIFQLIFELLPLAFIGIVLALFVSDILANNLSRELLRQQMAENQTSFLSTEAVELNSLEALGYRFELSHEEMLESYEIGMDLSTIIFSFTFGLSTILLAIVVPIGVTVHKNPQKILQ